MNDVAPSTQDVFGSEQTVLNALVTIRNSTLSPDDKALLRNLFLDYISADDLKKGELKEVINTHLQRLADALPNLTPKTGEETTPTTETLKPRPSGFQATNRARVKPNFGTNTKPATQTPEPAQPTLEPEPAEAQPTPQPTPPEPEPIPEPVVTQKPPETVATATEATAPMQQDYKVRINQIKHDINTAIGNPVNLVDTDEAAGREYMSSLLEAIKHASIGGPAADEAMARLEKAYQAAKEIIRNNPNIGKEKPPETPPTPAPQPTPPKPAPEPEPIPEPVVTQKPPEPAVAAAAPEPVKPPEPVEIAKPEATPVQKVTPGLYHRPSDEVTSEEKPSTLSNKAGSLWKQPANEQKDELASVGPITTPAYGTDLRQVSVASAEKKAAPEEKKTPAPTSSTLKPLSSTTSLPQKISKLEKTAAAAEKKAQEPIKNLEDPTVTEGLKQLLSEWKLFKSSGFLGTGPSGIEHPLYQRLAKLPMALIIAGRFEGATPEVKDGITSYMNGWRYEHGMVHDMGETFEHYLRRVIKLIIDKQRTSPLPNTEK